MRIARTLLTTVVALVVAAVASPAAEHQQPPSTAPAQPPAPAERPVPEELQEAMAKAAAIKDPAPMPIGTMSELMIDLIYPTSDAILYISSRTPTNDVEWNELRAKALTLAEAANLIMTPPRAYDALAIMHIMKPVPPVVAHPPLVDVRVLPRPQPIDAVLILIYPHRAASRAAGRTAGRRNPAAR